MQKNKLFIGLVLAVLLIGLAAFVAGRLLNGKIGTVGLGGPSASRVFISIDQITPAPELPGTKADVTGLFVERKDNTIIVQANLFSPGVGGVAGDSPIDENSGVRVEVVVTAATRIYRDVTQYPAPVNGEIQNIQQAAEDGTLDDLTEQTFLNVWGRRSGDRIIADTLFYSNPQFIKKSGS